MNKHIAAVALLALIAGCTQPQSAGQHTATASTAASQTTQTTQVVQASNEAPPMENGVYIDHEICPGEGGCPWVHWRANKPIELHAREDSDSPIVATLQSGEWALALGGEVRLIPERGLVQQDAQGLKAGDVVYKLGDAGEGFVDLWRRGQIVDWQASEDEGAIAWSSEAPAAPTAPAAPAASTLGWWVHVKREADGLEGWISDPDGFECMGPLAGDEGCRG